MNLTLTSGWDRATRAKTEVKFGAERAVFSAVYHAVLSALEEDPSNGRNTDRRILSGRNTDRRILSGRNTDRRGGGGGGPPTRGRAELALGLREVRATGEDMSVEGFSSLPACCRAGVLFHEFQPGGGVKKQVPHHQSGAPGTARLLHRPGYAPPLQTVS